MAQLAPYCKAYPAQRFQEFPGWAAPEQTSPSTTNGGDEDVEEYWFLQDNYVVTRGIMPDEEIVFDRVSPEWIEFCRTTLGFVVPEDLIDDSAPSSAVSGTEAGA